MKQNNTILIDYLSHGEENAYTARDLARLLGWRERDVTRSINALRKRGTIICSSVNGFFLPADDADISHFVRNMKGRIKDVEMAMKPALDYLENGGGEIC